MENSTCHNSKCAETILDLHKSELESEKRMQEIKRLREVIKENKPRELVLQDECVFNHLGVKICEYDLSPGSHYAGNCLDILLEMVRLWNKFHGHDHLG
jgi:hypothetical protein